MTREEAINVLKNEIRCVKSTSCLREECLNCTLTLPEHDILTALNMAIEALDSPTLMPGISDLIRQAVKEAIDEAYQRGLSDAWEAARKIAVSAERGGFSFAELSNIFGTRKTDVIFAENTAAKAIEKIRAYEERKKAEKEKVKVGDEVIIAGVTGIVTKVPEGDEKRVCYMDASGTVYCNNAYAHIHKTGRHFPQVEELLQQMKE